MWYNSEKGGIYQMKKFIAGLIFGLIIATSVVGLANSEITAKFTSFNLVIDGETKQLETQPLVYNGTSYLPLRELSNLVGYDVTYKADSKTIELTKSTPNVSADLEGWISLKDFFDKHGVQTYYGSTIKFAKGDKTFEFPAQPSIKDGEYQVSNETHTITLKIINSRTYLKVDEMKSLNLID